MAKITINLDNVKELEVLPAAIYECAIQDAEVKQGQKAAYIKWTMCVSNGEYTGRLLFNNTSLAPDAQFALKRFLEACKFEWGKKEFETGDVIGSAVNVRVAIKEYEGNAQNDVKGFISVE